MGAPLPQNAPFEVRKRPSASAWDLLQDNFAFCDAFQRGENVLGDSEANGVFGLSFDVQGKNAEINR